MTYLEIWNKHLENMKKKLVDYVPSLPVDSDYFAVIVEPRIDENIDFNAAILLNGNLTSKLA